jgi:hypothetical protein
MQLLRARLSHCCYERVRMQQVEVLVERIVGLFFIACFCDAASVVSLQC